MKINRFHSIDVLRFFANFCIVLTHTRVSYVRPTENLDGLMLGVAFIVYNICRLALPFFFIISGFFYGQSLSRGGSVNAKYQKTLQKLIMVYLCYVVLYALIPDKGVSFLVNTVKYGWLKTYYWHFGDITRDRLALVLHGTEYHLWFLPALIIGLSVVTFFILFKKEAWLIYVFIFSYLSMVVAKCLIPSVTIGHNHYDISGICKAISCTVCGYLIAQNPRWEVKAALKLIFAGVILLIVQNVWLWVNHIDYRSSILAGTLLCTSGIFMLALNYPDWGKGHFTSKFGLLTLWIYGLHPFVLHQLQPLGQYVSPWVWDLIFPILVYAVSLALVLLFRQLFATRGREPDRTLRMEFNR